MNTINHVALVVDSSGSMSPYVNKTEEVIDGVINDFRQSSLKWNQETRVSVYVFSSNTECVVFDMDVTRCSSSCYKFLGGNTSLNDAVKLAYDDTRLLPQKYGDHAFVMLVITDGEENWSVLKRVDYIVSDAKSHGNYTWDILVPNQRGILLAQKLGYPKDAIRTWDVSEQGLEAVRTSYTVGMENYFTMRSTGVKSLTAFSTVDLTKLSANQVKQNLQKLPVSAYKILVNPSNQAVMSRDIVEKSGLPYKNGNLFYELVKTEHIQPQKQLAIQHRKDDSVYAGSPARQMLGLPDNVEVKVKPGDHGDWNLFVQSTAPNRNIIPKQRALVIL